MIDTLTYGDKVTSSFMFIFIRNEQENLFPSNIIHFLLQGSLQKQNEAHIHTRTHTLSQGE